MFRLDFKNDVSFSKVIHFKAFVATVLEIFYIYIIECLMSSNYAG